MAQSTGGARGARDRESPSAGDGFDAALEALRFDPLIRRAIVAHGDVLVPRDELAACGRERAERLGRSWAYQATMALVAEARGGEIVIREVSFPPREDHPDHAPDDQFEACLERTIRSARIKTESSWEGEFVFPWPVLSAFNIRQGESRPVRPRDTERGSPANDPAGREP